MMSYPEYVLKQEEAAKLLGFSPRTLARLVAAKRGPEKIRLSAKRVGYRYSDILSWIESRNAA